jgi:predicted PurR-regulated permease PerM
MNEYLPPLSEPTRRWLRFGALLVAAAALLWLAGLLRGVLTPIAAALAIAYILNPAVTRLEHYSIRRVVSVSVGLAAVLGLAALLLLAGALQVIELVQQVPRYARDLYAWWQATFPHLRLAMGETLVSRVSEAAEGQAVAAAQTLAAELPGAFGRLVSWLTAAVLLPVYSFFFLLYFNEIVTKLREHLPAAYRPTILHIASTVDRCMSDFFRGRLLIAVLVGVLSGLGWLAAGVPYSLAFGAISIPLQLVPFMGILILPPVLLVTYLDAPAGAWFWPVLLAFAVYMAVQVLESFVLTPYVYAHSSGLHPITTVVALLAGAELAGVLGMLLSIPLASTLKSLAQEYLMPEVRRLAGAGEPAPISACAPLDRAVSGQSSTGIGDRPPEADGAHQPAADRAVSERI